MAKGDWAGSSFLAKMVRVGAVEQAVSPCVAIHAVLVLGAGGSEMPNLMTSVASGPGLEVLGASGANVPCVTTHETEVVHVDDQRGSRAHGGVLELRRAGDKVDEHVWGRGANCG